jgi:mRNA interferase RelE/StbE
MPISIVTVKEARPLAYQVTIKAMAVREFHDLGKDDKLRIGVAIFELGKEPRPPLVKKMAGMDRTYRIRQGDFRIMYEIEDKIKLVTVIKIGHRSNVYK